MEESRMDPAHASGSASWGDEKFPPHFVLRKMNGKSLVVRTGSEQLQALDLIASVARDLGREVRVFVSPAALDSEDTSTVGKPTAAQEEEPEDFYDFTAEDYARIMASRKEEIYLKTKKIREQEQAARRAHMTKAIIRVQFPDNFVLEATFRSADSLSSLIELLQRALLRPDLPFYLYTVPPKQRIKDLQQSMIDAGFSPGALIYFAYETSKGSDNQPNLHGLRTLEVDHICDLKFRCCGISIFWHHPLVQGSLYRKNGRRENKPQMIHLMSLNDL